MSEEIKEPKKTTDIPRKIGEYTGYILLVFIAIILCFSLFKVAVWGYGVLSPFYGYTSQEKLSKSLSVAISNKADLSAVKTIFNNRTVSKSFYSRWFEGGKGYYLEPISLARVLEDMRAEYFLSDQKNDIYLNILDALIKENNEINPFDKLQSHQKDYFSNIRIKLHDKYSVVENDISKISDELNKQNQLVKEYLSDATVSLTISIIGLVFALLVSIIQIVQNRKKDNKDDMRHYHLLLAVEEKFIQAVNKIINLNSETTNTEKR